MFRMCWFVFILFSGLWWFGAVFFLFEVQETVRRLRPGAESFYPAGVTHFNLLNPQVVESWQSLLLDTANRCPGESKTLTINFGLRSYRNWEWEGLGSSEKNMAAFSHIFFSRKRCLGPIDTDNTPTRELCHALTKCTGGTMQSSVGVLCFLDRGMLREYIHIFASYFHAILWFCVLEHIAQPCAVTKTHVEATRYTQINRCRRGYLQFIKIHIYTILHLISQNIIPVISCDIRQRCCNDSRLGAVGAWAPAPEPAAANLISQKVADFLDSKMNKGWKKMKKKHDCGTQSTEWFGSNHHCGFW